jgi:undecaprenyl-diphosphatase
MGAFVLYGLIFYFAALHIRDARLRLPLQAACVAIIVLTGVERVYVGHHWPSDVLGGYYAGALVVGTVLVVHQYARRHTSNLRRDRSFSRATAAIDPE